MKMIFLTKRGRPDINTAVSFLSTRSNNPTEEDWYKLIKTIAFPHRTKEDILTLEADDTQT